MMMNCWKATRLMSEAHERKLDMRERLALRMHTLMCSGCTNYREHLDFISRAARQLREGREP